MWLISPEWKKRSFIKVDWSTTSLLPVIIPNDKQINVTANHWWETYKIANTGASVFDKTLNLWEVIQKEQPVSLSNTIRQIAAGGLFRIGNFRPKLPILVLASTSDRMVSVNCSKAIAQRWQAPILEHPTAGHDLTADDPNWVVERMREFLS